MVHGKQQLDIVLLGVGEELPRQIEFVILDERLSDRQTLRFKEGVGHAAADERGVGDVHEVFDHFNFVADFCSA